MMRLLLPIFALLLALSGCATNPVTGQQQFTAFMSPQQELRVGAEEHLKIIEQFGVYDDATVGAMVARLGSGLSAASERPDLRWTFTVLDSDIVNAFALPGGYIYVTRGLVTVAQDEAGIAAVLAHEIGHVTARHSAERYSRGMAAGLLGAVLGAAIDDGGQIGALAGLGAGLYLSAFSRDQERQADELGIRYLTRAGYNPYAMSEFLAVLEAESALQAEITGREDGGGFSFFSTHPNTGERVVAARQLAAGLPVPPGADDGRDSYLDIIDGVTYGGSARDGFVRGRDFIHPELRFAYRVPPQFTLLNAPGSVTALGPRDATILFDIASGEGVRDPRAYIVNVWAKGRRFSSLEPLRIDGQPAATAKLTLEGRTLRLVAIRFDSGRYARFLMASNPADARAFADVFRQTAFSFRRLSAREAASARPLRVAVIRVQPGETVATLANRMPFESHREERFRLLNGLGTGAEIRPGERVKLIVQ